MSQHPRDTSLEGWFFFLAPLRTLDLEGVFSGLNSVKREATTMASACHFQTTTWSSQGLSNTTFPFFF